MNQIFNDYIAECQDQERHTSEAIDAMDFFYNHLFSILNGDTAQLNETWEYFTQACVEFEESGFLAGYKRGCSSKKKITCKGSIPIGS